jgi:iron complex outermembrane receptor protein
MNYKRSLYGIAMTILVMQSGVAIAAAESTVADMSLEALMNVEVSSVSKKDERASQVAAAVYVITPEEIRRSGATCIPEALRLVPGLHVARIDTNRWAIGSRGFNGLFANKLLVLIDGRSVYTPMFSGVYWDAQDTLLEDIERIEVIRGPGGTVWGANAVNGVINIITKDAADTVGGLVTGGTGTEELGQVGARYGTALGEHGHIRTYTKYFDRDQSNRVTEGENFDQWSAGQAGVRYDWKGEQDVLNIQGDAYSGQEGLEGIIPSVLPPYFNGVQSNTAYTGMNLKTRWEREHSDTVRSKLQFYYDRANRDDAILNLSLIRLM